MSKHKPRFTIENTGDGVWAVVDNEAQPGTERHVGTYGTRTRTREVAYDMNHRMTWEERKPRHLNAARTALACLDNIERNLREVESEPAESREQCLIYAAEGLAKALNRLRPALAPRDFAEATKVLR